MDFKDIVEKLMDSQKVDLGLVESIGNDSSRLIRDGQIRIIDLVKSMDPVLTNGSHSIRLRGVEILVKVITSLPIDLLTEKEIEVMTEFLCLRLIDHKTMEIPTLRCLSYFLGCEKRPDRYSRRLLDYVKNEINVRKMEAESRFYIYELAKKIIYERRQVSSKVDSDLIYSLVHIIEGENNPRNLILCYHIVEYVLRNFDNLEPYIDDIFEWLSSYYPIDYTPTDADDGKTIHRSELVKALYDCLYATPLNSENLQTLLIEKLESGVMTTKLESFSCLIRCYEEFPLSAIKNYASTLWTSIRMNCLKKLDLIDRNVLEMSLKTLTALARRLAEDGDLYFMFISDMYDELSLAFRKTELDLFEPASKLLTHAILPSVTGFNYVLSKLLPTSLTALEANDFKPLAGLAYMLEELQRTHPNTKLKEDIEAIIDKMVQKLLDSDCIKEDILKVLDIVVRLKVCLAPERLIQLISKLHSELYQSQLDIEGSLANVCVNYKKFDIIYNDDPANVDLSLHMGMIEKFDSKSHGYKGELTSDISTRFSIYLRIIIMDLNDCTPAETGKIDQATLSLFMGKIREYALLNQSSINLVNKIAKIHAIVLNKLSSDLTNPILMSYFASEFCQKLQSSDSNRTVITEVYLPILRWIFKSLVVRNHQFATPMINLLLNFITSDQVSQDLAITGSQVFGFILQEDHEGICNPKFHYQTFALYKQKFYTQTRNEIKIRYELQISDIRKNLLLCTLASLVPYLHVNVYRNDINWLIRELLKVLLSYDRSLKTSENDTSTQMETCDEDLIHVIYGCVESLIQKDVCSNISGFLNSLVDLSLNYAQNAKTLQVRRRALACLSNVATSFKASDLLTMRSRVVDALKPCLSDKKRLVRQAAADARLRWVVIGQPIGS